MIKKLFFLSKHFFALLFMSIFFFLSCSQDEKLSTGKSDDLTSESADVNTIHSRITTVSTININVNGSGGPDVNIRKGVAAPGQNGFFNDQETRDYLDYITLEGATIFNGTRNLFKDPETTEFYNLNGVFKNRQIPAFTDIRKYAKDAGLEMISQVGGTPLNSGYEFDKSYYKVLPWGPMNDFAPLPKTGNSMQEFQRNFTEWAINADKAVGSDYHSIWIGTQEIAHTIGFPGGLENNTEENKKNNIMRYIDYWKPIAAGLRNAGAKVGGVQLNSSNANLYQFAVDYLIEKNVKLDFLTFQFYQWGDVADLTNAIAALDSYNKVFPGTKIIIDRGMFTKIDGNPNDCIDFLLGEKKAIDNANKIYAWTLDQAINGLNNNKNTRGYKVRAWAYKTPIKRKPLSNLPAGINGYALMNTTSSKLSLALWNTSDNEYNLNVKLDNSLITTAAVTVQKLTTTEIFNVSGVTWNSTTKNIGTLNIKKNEILLVNLN